MEDFGTFYVETALSGYGSVLQLTQTTVGRARMLFGTDFPGKDDVIWDLYHAITNLFLRKL